MTPELIHIFSAGDHYSPKTGSSVPTVIYELSQQHHLQGGATRVIVGRGTFDGFPPYPVGGIYEVDYRPFPERQVRMIDACLGAINLPRINKWKCYGGALGAIPEDFHDWILVHGEPAIIRPLRRFRPRAKLALYCHYELLRWYTRPEVNRVLNDINIAVCISDYIARYVSRKAGRRSAKLAIVLNGVDTDRFTPAAAPPAGDPVILYVGRVHPEKGVHHLAEAALILHRRNRRFRLRIVGGQLLAKGVPLSEYESQIRRDLAVLGDAVEFVPFVEREHIPALFREAHIFCAPSVANEAFGLVVAEAMSCGLAVVASDRGAIPEVGGNAIMYFTVPNSTVLADQLERLLINQELRQTMSIAARQRAMELTWSAAYQRLMGELQNHGGAPRATVARSNVAIR